MIRCGPGWVWGRHGGGRGRLLGAGLVGLASLLAAPPAHAYTVSLTAADIEAMVRPHFPQVHTGPLGTVTLSDPRVILRSGSDRLGLGLDVAGEMAGGLATHGQAVVEGEVAYDPARGEFHLREPRVTHLVVEGLPDPYAGFVASTVSAIARQEAPLIVLFKVPADDLAGAATLRVLKSARVKDGKLVLELGM